MNLGGSIQTINGCSALVHACTPGAAEVRGPRHAHKDALGELTQAGLLEGCRPLEEGRKRSGAQPLGQPPTFAHPSVLAEPQEEETAECKEAGVFLFYKLHMAFHFLIVWLGWVLAAARGI